ncbi:MAG: DNA mismatch repair protein MutS, partial [Clostridia bacterium]
QSAIIALMAHIGSFVPAESANIPILDRIFTRVGASDDLSQGQSTFMVEMSELANILENATPNSLVILDEIGRGTSTFDGMSIAKSVIEYITGENGVNCKTLFATHYHELTEIEKMDSKVKNYNIAVKKRGDEITFLRRIVKGAADDSYGIEVAKLAGVPELVVQRAKIILKEIEKETLNIQKNNYHEQSVEQPYQTNDNEKEIIENLKTIDFTTITPIEALNILYNINQKLK